MYTVYWLRFEHTLRRSTTLMFLFPVLIAVISYCFQRDSALGCLLLHQDAVIIHVSLFCDVVSLFPQQRKLMGSSAQISSGVCRCGPREQVPEEGSGRFRRVPACAGVGSGSLPCNLDRRSHVIVLITGITLSTLARPLHKKAPM